MRNITYICVRLLATSTAVDVDIDIPGHPGFLCCWELSSCWVTCMFEQQHTTREAPSLNLLYQTSRYDNAIRSICRLSRTANCSGYHHSKCRKTSRSWIITHPHLSPVLHQFTGSCPNYLALSVLWFDEWILFDLRGLSSLSSRATRLNAPLHLSKDT